MPASPKTTFIGKRGRRVRQVKCITYPNRTRLRVFRPKDAGNIVCRILAQSTSAFGTAASASAVRTELRRELDRCFPCSDTEQSKVDTSLTQAMAAAAESVATDQAKVIAIAIAVLAALLILPRLITLLPRAALVLLPAGARVAVTQIPVVLARLRQSQAANDSFFRVLQGLRKAA